MQDPRIDRNAADAMSFISVTFFMADGKVDLLSDAAADQCFHKALTVTMFDCFH
jgi:hypothetical protein